MPKGHYTVDDPKGSGHADTSFRACVIVLLVFLLFCVTIIVILLVVRKDTGGASSGEDRHDGATAAGRTGDKTSTSESPPHREEHKSASEDKHGETASGTLNTTEKPPPNIGESTATPTILTTTDNVTTSGDHIGAGSRYSSEGRSPPESRDNSTSTEHPTSTSTVHSDSSERRSSPEETDEATGKDTSSTSEPPAILPAPTLPPPVKPVPCETPKCKNLAANMLNTMGHEADPCRHFYEYACGGLRRNKYLLEPDYTDEAWQRISDQVNEVNISSPISYKKFKAFEESCKNYDPAEDEESWKVAVFEEMTKLGELAVEGSDFKANFTHLFLELLRRDSPLIFDVTLDINDDNISKFAIKIFPAQLRDSQMYPEDNGLLECQSQAIKEYGNLNRIYNETKKCMNQGIGRSKTMTAAKEALTALGIFSSSEDEEKLNKTLEDYAEFLNLDNEALGEKVIFRLELQNREPDLKTTSDLNAVFGNLNIDWAAITEHLVGRPLKDGEHTQLYGTRYFRDINDKFKSKERQRQLHNALLVAFAAARHRDLLLPDVAAALYLGSFTTNLRSQLSRDADDFLFTFTTTFQKELDRASWLQGDSHKALKDNLEHRLVRMMVRNVTDTPEIMDSLKLDEALKHFDISETEFVRNVIALMGRNRKRLYARIDEDPKNHIWTHFVKPYDTEGIAIYRLNVIAIPLGAVQKPFFDPEYLSHIQMAGYGFAVAQQVMHNINLIGMQFNTMTTDKPVNEYKEKIPSLSVFKKDVKVEYMNLTGSTRHAALSFEFSEYERLLKNNEFFSDRMGIELAYKSMKRKHKEGETTLPFLSLSNDQSFFVFLAQKYCSKLDYSSLVVEFFESSGFPPETRVENMVHANGDFYTAFNCRRGDETDDQFPYFHRSETDVPVGEADLSSTL